MKYGTVLGLMLLLAGAAVAQENPSPTALTLGDAHITAPAGWGHVDTKPGDAAMNGLVIFPPKNADSRRLVVLVMPGQDLKGVDARQAFDSILKNAIAPGERLVQYSELPVRKGEGYDFQTRSMIVADREGHRSVRIGFAANPAHRLEMLIVSADSQDTLKYYEDEVTSLLNSYTFDSASAPARADDQERGATQPHADGGASSSKAAAGSIRSHVQAEGSVLLCTDPARLDAAMDFAKYGDSYNALRALRNDAFFRVNGPASLDVREFDRNSRWPKAFVTVVDGPLAGRTGWVVLAELKDLPQPTR